MWTFTKYLVSLRTFKKYLVIECIFLSQGQHYDSFPDFTPSSDANWSLTDSQQRNSSQDLGVYFERAGKFEFQNLVNKNILRTSLDLNFSKLRISQTPVGIWWRSKIRKRIVMSSFWRKNKLYLTFSNMKQFPNGI